MGIEDRSRGSGSPREICMLWTAARKDFPVSSWISTRTELVLPSVEGYFQKSLASSTHTTYKAALKRFYSFCSRYNILSPFPVTE